MDFKSEDAASGGATASGPVTVTIGGLGPQFLSSRLDGSLGLICAPIVHAPAVRFASGTIACNCRTGTAPSGFRVVVLSCSFTLLETDTARPRCLRSTRP